MAELKPCPFCGKANFDFDEPNLMLYSAPYYLYYNVRCRECQYTSPPGRSRAEAIEAWNRRADDGN